MPKPTNSFKSLGNVKVQYARTLKFPYGSKGQPYTYYCTQEFEKQLIDCFSEMWTACRYGTPEIMTCAGTWVEKPGQHGNGTAFDLDAIFWKDFTFVTLDYPKYRAFYLGIESIVRVHFGTVLNYHFNSDHEDHLHIDTGFEVIFNGQKSETMYLQAVLAYVYDIPVQIDGVYGTQTAEALERLLEKLKIKQGIEKPEGYRRFLRRVAADTIG